MTTTPQLVAIAGPLNGMLFMLDKDEVAVGRDPGNQICLSDPLVSRRHCLLRQSASSYLLQDLDSSNGTAINDVPVRERLLAHGDRIKIGETHFLFLAPDSEAAVSTFDGHLTDVRVTTNTSYTIRLEEAIYLQPEKVTAALPSPNVARNLHALLMISTAINQIRKLPDLQRRLLELIIEVIPAERGAIILSRERFGLSDPFVGFDREDGWQNDIRVSRTVIERVRRDHVAIMSNDVADHQPFSKATSLVLRQIQSLLAVPISLDEQLLGVIYLDSSQIDFRFEEDHLQLLTAIAAIAAVAFDNVRRVEWLENEARRLRDEISLNHDLIGESAAMQAVYQTLAKVAPSDSTVLLRGESGTGKEMVARAIHLGSSRADRPFIAINCAGLSDTLLESDLFGHEKGAFTGAVGQKKGKFEIADGGTVFLDELGELPQPLQAKLLRALQTREFERVGGTRKIKVDIRIIAATNRDLEAAIKDGGFRADLYYRLNVVSITLPPLRDRRDDIPLLAQYFATKFGQRCNRQIKGLTQATRALLINYDWPGNVRELENAIERAVVLGVTDFILPEDLPDALHETTAPPDVTPAIYHSATRDAKKQIVLQALEDSGGNFTQAAKQLGIHPNNLHRLVRNLGLKTQLKK
ncbi:MAG: sigma 54-interacting transcriptional regulator [Blastocatellales bacterium]